MKHHKRRRFDFYSIYWNSFRARQSRRKNSLTRGTNIEINPIRTEADYQAALKEVETLFNAPPNTPEYDRLDLLSTLAEAYEKGHYPIEAPDPIEAIL